jgi:hypothetical protein
MRAFAYWIDKPIHHLWVIAAIAVQENDNFAFRRDCTQTRMKRTSISASRLCDDASPGSCCNFRRSIRAAVIHDDDLVGDMPRDFLDHFPDCRFLIQRTDND